MTKICYLVNQYPKVSHTFIRREIHGLETLGAEVKRISIRRTEEVLLDEKDKLEEQKTDLLLENKSQLIAAFFRCVFTKPAAFASGLKKSLELAKASRQYLKSLIYLIEACRLYEMCEDAKVDHLHIHFGTNPTAVGTLCRALGGPSYSFTVHGPDEFDDPKGLGLKIKIAGSKFVVAITSFCKSQLWRWAEYRDWSKVNIVHCSIDGQMIDKPIAAITSSNQFLHIGRLSEQKGQMLLVESMRLLKESGIDAHLNVIGDGEFRPAIESYIAEHQLESNITLLGWKSGDDIQEYLDQSSALVLPSFAEGLPVVIMESFARSRPVITTSIAGIPELVDEQCGQIVVPGESEKLAQAMADFISLDIEVIEMMGAEGRRRVLSEHHAVTEAQKLLDLVEQQRLEQTRPEQETASC